MLGKLRALSQYDMFQEPLKYLVRSSKYLNSVLQIKFLSILHIDDVVVSHCTYQAINGLNNTEKEKDNVVTTVCN